MLTAASRTFNERSSSASFAPKKFGYWTIGLPLAVVCWAAVFMAMEKHPVLAFGQNMPLVFLGVVACVALVCHIYCGRISDGLGLYW